MTSRHPMTNLFIFVIILTTFILQSCYKPTKAKLNTSTSATEQEVTSSIVPIYDSVESEYEDDCDFNTEILKATVKINDSKSQIGTGLVAQVSYKFVGGPPNTIYSYYMLITANHVLSETSGDFITVVLRGKDDNGVIIRKPRLVRIRDKGEQLWSGHQSSDVAVLPFGLPPDFVEQLPIITLNIFAFGLDRSIERDELYPGTTVNIVGYPRGFEADLTGTAVLRSGVIASSPTPSGGNDASMIVDYRVDKVDSGAPVYIYKKITTTSLFSFIRRKDRRIILGIVTGKYERDTGQDANATHEQISLAHVTLSKAIRETVDKIKFVVRSNGPQTNKFNPAPVNFSTPMTEEEYAQRKAIREWAQSIIEKSTSPLTSEELDSYQKIIEENVLAPYDPPHGFKIVPTSGGDKAFQERGFIVRPSRGIEGATVFFRRKGQLSSESPTAIPELCSVKFPMEGDYFLWVERKGKATSPVDRAFSINARSSETITIIEDKVGR